MIQLGTPLMSIQQSDFPWQAEKQASWYRAGLGRRPLATTRKRLEMISHDFLLLFSRTFKYQNDYTLVGLNGLPPKANE